MMNIIKAGAMAMMLGIGAQQAHGQLIINELMQSNIDCVMDDINQFPDSWVEVYNAGTAAVNLSAYSIGMTDDAKTAWHLPSKEVAAGGYALIYCDKEATGLHTDFRLESGKDGSVYLFNGTSIADKVTKMKKQPAPNIAYGREADASDTWGYMLSPSPGKSNGGGVTKNILGDPLFSSDGSVSDSKRTVTVMITIPDDMPEATEVRYTTDGSEPTMKSPLYQGPLTFSSSAVVRAKLFCDGWLSPRSVVRSYLTLGHDITLPVISIVGDNKYFNDTKIGILVDGTYNSQTKNYQYDWRRPVNIEMFEADGTTCFINQLCETRVMGAASRGEALKSLAIYANKRFGVKRFEYEFFPDQKPGLTDFKSLALRNAGNDFNYLYMRDAIIQRTMAQNADLDWQAWRPAIVFINGKYRGMLNIRERSNDDNIYTNYDGLEDIDMFENWWEQKAGDRQNLDAFTAFYTEHGHTMAEYGEWMDVTEFINLMAMNLFYCNLDFPGNNIVMWRPRTEGGKWRWIAKDTDFGLGLYDRTVKYNTIEWIYNNDYDRDNNWANTYDATRLFRRMMEDADFAREFIDRCAIYMGDFMNERGTREIWDPMYEMIRYEYPIHRKLFNEWWPNYADEMRKAQTWIKQRPGQFYTMLANYYKLGTPVTMVINNNVADADLAGVGIYVNGIRLTRGRFDGQYFAGRQLNITAVPEDGRRVTAWEVIENGTRRTVEGPSLSLVMPTGQLIIRATYDIDDGIEAVKCDAAPSSLACYNSAGQRLSAPQHGLNIIGGRKVVY